MKPIILRDREINTSLPAYIMGILNITEDSFWSGSRYYKEEAVNVALKMVEEGVDIIDIGGESSRPGANYINAEEEIKRVIPVIEGIRKKTTCPISIDTRKLSVLKAAYEAGADILNDISALEDDKKIAAMVAKMEIGVILMHKRGNPIIMQNDTEYSDIIEEVSSYLSNRVKYALSQGIKGEKIIIDAGIGFGKNTIGNIKLINSSEELRKLVQQKSNCFELNHVMMALSRKKCIGDMTGRPVEQRLAGTLTACCISVLTGATMLRVHDVKEIKDMLSVMDCIKRGCV